MRWFLEEPLCVAAAVVLTLTPIPLFSLSLFWLLSFLVDVDECELQLCEEECVNLPGSFRCFCDGRQGKKLSQDLRTCEVTLGFPNPAPFLFMSCP